MNVAFVGLGNMGGAQARLIARSGLELAVYDSFPAAIETFSGIARLATSAADAARDAEVACVCVRDDQQVDDAVFGEQGLAAGLAAGSLLLIHSTVRVETLERLQAKLSQRGIALVDAPVTRTSQNQDEPYVLTMFGGEPNDVGRARAVCRAFSTGMEHMGPLGAGMAMKIANNLVTWVELVVGLQARDLAAHYGVSLASLCSIMKANGNLTPTMEALLDGQDRVPPGTNAEYDEFLASHAGIGEKDLALAIEHGTPAGLNMAVAERAREVLRAVMLRSGQA